MDRGYRLPSSQHYVRLSKEWNQSTGQIYDEYTLSGRDLNIGDSNTRWYMTKELVAGAPKSRSLFDMVLRVLLPCTKYITSEDLEALPTRVVAQIWRHLEMKPMCLHDWKTFSSVLLEDEDHSVMGHYHFHQSIPRPTADFKYYVTPMTSLTADFITHLVIGSDLYCVMSELLCLAQMKNLGILEMISPEYDQGGGRYPHVTSRLIQSWAGMDNPFPLLRVLKMHGRLSMTPATLIWVSSFPSLAVYDVCIPCSMGWGGLAKKLGWEVHSWDRFVNHSLAREMVAMAHGDDETRGKEMQVAARGVDSKLQSVYNNQHRRVKFVAHGQAPQLADQLVPFSTESAPEESRPSTPPPRGRDEAVDFWRYALIGQLTDDRDLRRAGVEMTRQAMAGPLVLPSRPMARLDLGLSEDFSNAGRRTVMIRLGGVGKGQKSDLGDHAGGHSSGSARGDATMPQSTAKSKRKSNSEDSGASAVAAPSLRKKKRTNMQDMLQSFSG